MGSDGGVFAVGAGATADGAGERGGGAWGSVDCCIGVGLAGSIRAPGGLAQFIKGLFSSNDWFSTLGRGGGAVGATAVGAMTEGRTWCCLWCCCCC